MATRTTLRRRLRLAVVIPAALAVGASGAVFIALQWRASLRDNEESLQTLALVLAENSAPALAFASAEDATKLLQAVHRDPAVKLAALYNSDGRLFAQYQAPDAERPAPTHAGTYGMLREKKRMTIFHPVREGGRTYGTLFLRWDLGPWHAEMRTYVISAGIILAACIVGAVLIGNVLQRSIATPLLALTQTAESIAREKNYTVRASVPETQELATLATAFNQMLAEILQAQTTLAAAHEELERHSDILEKTVEERTARLREVIGELEAFSYSIAHDMRAPLRSMQGFSRLLLEEHRTRLDDEGVSFLKRIVASADRLDRLIQDVLNYSRIVRQELHMELVNTRHLIEEIIATYPNLQQPHADVRIEGAIPSVWANAAALTQVVSNLLGNAVKFVKQNTKPVVTISADRCTRTDEAGKLTNWVRLSFTDNGIGIPKDSQHRLFAMFQRLHRPELYEGTGIGLAIVRKAVQRMNGRLGLESDEGRGSRFWVEFRADAPQ